MLSFPLARTAFFDLLPIGSSTFDLPELVEVSRTRGGGVLTADVGARLFEGHIALGNLLVPEARPSLALINVLRAGARSFLIADRHRLWPQADPGGLLLGASSPAIAAIDVSLRGVALEGLPAGYTLSAGDLIGWTYGSSPLSYALHEIVDGGIADGAGDMATIELTPPVRPGVVVGAAVVLARPVCKATIRPGSVAAGTTRATTIEGIAFDWQQTLG